MARARNIKPSFFTNETLAEVEPLGRILFAGLWTIADREGRLERRPKRIKTEILPYDECDIAALLQQLERKGFIVRYIVGGIEYVQVLSFTKHQNPHVKEAASTVPGPYEPGSSLMLEQCEHSASTVLVPEIPERARLIPDSPLPLTDGVALQPLSGSPAKTNGRSHSKVNGHGKAPNGTSMTSAAKEILGFLNRKATKNFPDTDTNVGIIVARFREGFTPEQVQRVVAMKIAQWNGKEDMREYLRPETLFGRKKFSQYVGELVDPPAGAEDAP